MSVSSPSSPFCCCCCCRVSSGDLATYSCLGDGDDYDADCGDEMSVSLLLSPWHSSCAASAEPRVQQCPCTVTTIARKPGDELQLSRLMSLSVQSASHSLALSTNLSLRYFATCTLKRDTVAVLAVLPRYWGRNTRDSGGDGDQSCGTTAAMGLSFSHVHEN